MNHTFRYIRARAGVTSALVIILAACSGPPPSEVDPVPAQPVAAPVATASPVAAIAKMWGAKIGERFDAGSGLIGHVLHVNEFDVQILYTNDDGSRILHGRLLAADGRDLHGEFIAQYTPDIDITDRYPALAEVPNGAITTGSIPSTLRVIYDPRCGYCKMLYRNLVDSDVQVHWHPVSVLGPESSLIAAAMLSSSASPGEIMNLVQEAGGVNTLMSGASPSQAAAEAIQKNLMASEAMGMNGTPGLVWLDGSGRAKSSRGMPPPEQLQVILEEARIRG